MEKYKPFMGVQVLAEITAYNDSIPHTMGTNGTSASSHSTNSTDGMTTTSGLWIYIFVDGKKYSTKFNIVYCWTTDQKTIMYKIISLKVLSTND